MENYTERPVTIRQLFTIKDDQLYGVTYESSIKAGDVLKRLVFFGDSLKAAENYHVIEVMDRFLRVQFRDGGKVKTGTLSFDDILGGIMPAPVGQVIVHYQLFTEKKGEK